jgi:hypothetical protein
MTPYHKLPKQERADMLRKAAELSSRFNPSYQMSAEQVRWLMFFRGEKNEKTI